MQSLPSSAVVLDIGAGNLTLDLPNVIRMDVTLTPYVDVVGDAHMMPFLPGTFDFVFSLAVIEHLRQPFVAAQEMYDVLRNGGYVYGECNFVFAYHGYPHHYFNASEQGLEEVFAPFEKFRTGVAPYQMPSDAIRMLFVTYLKSMTPSEDPEVSRFRSCSERCWTNRSWNFRRPVYRRRGAKCRCRSVLLRQEGALGTLGGGAEGGAGDVGRAAGIEVALPQSL